MKKDASSGRRVFVIAMECEADAVRPWLKNTDVLIVSGIGKVNAAAATQKAISEFSAGIVINAGLAGGFAPGMNPGDVYEIEAAVEYDFDLAKLNGTRVGVLDEYDTPYIELESTGMFPKAILATGDHFNDGESDYALIRDELKATVRDMEGAAVAHVCKKNSIPCRSLKCITNVAGKGPMTGQYAINREACLKKLSEALGSYLDSIRP